MKKASALMAAAASMALTSVPSGSHVSFFSSGSIDGTGSGADVVAKARRVMKKEKFAPTFDGLRFIETLVTAHR